MFINLKVLSMITYLYRSSGHLWISEIDVEVLVWHVTKILNGGCTYLVSVISLRADIIGTTWTRERC